MSEQGNALSTSPTGAVRIGAALSGGGFRAAAFHLGVLKRLDELGLLSQAAMLSTVSGGSITGALYALRSAGVRKPVSAATRLLADDLSHGASALKMSGLATAAGPAIGPQQQSHSMDATQCGSGESDSMPGLSRGSVDELISELVPVLTGGLRSQALFGSPWRVLRVALSFLSFRVSRIQLIVEALDRALFHGATLDKLPGWIVINATNLRTGKGWKFFHDAAGDFLMGATRDTGRIRVSEAVAASAAYPGLTDTFALNTEWESLSLENLDPQRWERPPQRAGQRTWRERFGKGFGPVRVPLVDGGLYDNEGVNALRGAKITHAIVSTVTPPEGDTDKGFRASRYLRLVEVIHDRLGAATRQLTHEMSHGTSPTAARDDALTLAQDIERTAAEEGEPLSDAFRARLLDWASIARRVALVGVPPRGPQFSASAIVMLQRTELARNAFAANSFGAVDVPEAYRGLPEDIAESLSRVRTDLDALDPMIVEMLMAQGYFLTDFMCKLTMPALLGNSATMPELFGSGLTPEWPRAHAAVQQVRARPRDVAVILERAARASGFFGDVPRRSERLWMYFSVAFGSVLCVLLLLVVILAMSSAGSWICAALGVG